MKELRKIDFNEKTFECGGRKFRVDNFDSLSFERYKELQKISLEFGFNANIEQIFNSLKSAWEDLNKLKFAEAAVKIHNILYGITRLEEKDDPALRISALFINEEGEDVAVYDEAKMRSKIDCWAKELDITPFFYLASSLATGWMPAYQILIQNGLGTGETKEEKGIKE